LGAGLLGAACWAGVSGLRLVAGVVSVVIVVTSEAWYAGGSLISAGRLAGAALRRTAEIGLEEQGRETGAEFVFIVVTSES
jgi:hypothetical protein